MKKESTKTYLIIALMLVFLGCGVIAGCLLNWVPGLNTFNVTNNTHKMIKVLQVHSYSGEIETNLTIKDIAPEKTIKFQLIANGSTISYSLKANFANGSQIIPPGGYELSGSLFNISIKE